MGFMNRYREIPHRGRALDHIAENLTNLFNSRRGFGSPIHDFGLGQADPMVNTVDATQVLLREIIADVLRYEPRLQGPTLRTVARTPDLRLLLELRGQLEGRTVLFKLRYHQLYGGVQVEAFDAE